MHAGGSQVQSGPLPYDEDLRVSVNGSKSFGGRQLRRIGWCTILVRLSRLALACFGVCCEGGVLACCVKAVALSRPVTRLERQP